MKTNGKYKKWIDATYQEFAINGPDFSLKALSKKTKLPRATFYYHFESKDHLVEELLKHHYQKNKAFQSELKKIKELIPELYVLMHKYRDAVRFHQQLLRNSHIREFYEVYSSYNQSSIKIMLPLIKPYFGKDPTDDEIFQFYNTLTDAWYSRLNFSVLSVEYMINLAEEIMNKTIGLYHKNQPNSVKYFQY